MGAEQRRAALRVMTPCEFSVIFVDLHERPYLGETHFRLDISGDLRWFEMEKNLGNLRAAAMQPDDFQAAGRQTCVQLWRVVLHTSAAHRETSRLWPRSPSALLLCGSLVAASLAVRVF